MKAETAPAVTFSRFDDLCALLGAVGLNTAVRARPTQAIVVTPLDPAATYRWVIEAIEVGLVVFEQPRSEDGWTTPLERCYMAWLADGAAHPMDVAAEFVRFLAKRLEIRGPLIL